MPLGAYVLASGEPTALRWPLSIVVVMLLALLMSGWRYDQELSATTSVGLGGVSGLLGGFGQIAGPPMIAFWMAGPHPTSVVRANLIVFFALVSVSTFTSYSWNGLFTAEVFRVTAVLAPAYAVALYAGWYLFGQTSGAGYRPLAYAVIALAAVTSIPALDGVLR